MLSMADMYISGIRLLPSNPRQDNGSDHLYAHLSEAKRMADGEAETGDDQLSATHPALTNIAKGDCIVAGDLTGFSGDTGSGSGPNLHVHIQSFLRSGMPVNKGNPASYPTDKTPETYVADRISVCMNFIWYLPPDDLPPNDPGNLPAIEAYGKLLSPRGAYARIPVYMTKGGPVQLCTIDSSKISCYAVRDMQHDEDTTWYQIHFRTQPEAEGWVPDQGMVSNRSVVWVHVEDSPLTELPVRMASPAVIFDGIITNVRSEGSSVSPILGQLQQYIPS